MRYKQLSEQPKTFVLVMDTNEEISNVLKHFAVAQHLWSSSFKAIGAVKYAKLGWFNWETKNYEIAVEFEEQVELLSMIGDVALKDGSPQVHAHMVVGRRNGAAFGGHLLKAVVRPTCELILTENPKAMEKEIDPESGLALIRF
jgi:uncharacterized protein